MFIYKNMIRYTWKDKIRVQDMETTERSGILWYRGNRFYNYFFPFERSFSNSWSLLLENFNIWTYRFGGILNPRYTAYFTIGFIVYPFTIAIWMTMVYLTSVIAYIDTIYTFDQCGWVYDPIGTLHISTFNSILIVRFIFMDFHF